MAGVDTSCAVNGSPSSRRAWIEISGCPLLPTMQQVALLAEGVDRNQRAQGAAINYAVSPSSRRAWIEITIASWTVCRVSVALLAEGVDRNTTTVSIQNQDCVALLAEGVDRNRDENLQQPAQMSRPPRGGRG